MKYYQPIKHKATARFKTERTAYQFESLGTSKVSKITKEETKIIDKLNFLATHMNYMKSEQIAFFKRFYNDLTNRLANNNSVSFKQTMLIDQMIDQINTKKRLSERAKMLLK